MHRESFCGNRWGTFLAGAVLALSAALPRHAAAQEAKDDVLLITTFRGPGATQIFSIHGDGSGRKALTSGRGMPFDPSLSPDGKRVVFVGNLEGEDKPAGLCVMNADGSGCRRLADKGLPEGSPMAPAWSPDGKHIAFSYAQQEGSPLYVVDADGRNPRTVGQAKGMMPVWSPDGKRLLFAQFVNGDEWSLWAVDADGGNMRRLVKGAQMGAWSPDGKWLAYVSLSGSVSFGEPPARKVGLFLARADGSRPKRLAGGPDETVYGVQWSADGKRLYFTRRGPQKAPEGRPGKPPVAAEPPPSAIYALDLDGRNLRRVTDAKEPEWLGGSLFLASETVVR